MPRIEEIKKLNHAITIKLTHEDFMQLRALADRERSPLAEWSRLKLLQAVRAESPSPVLYALMAEISATEAILIDLLCAIGRDGKITQQKAQAIVDAAHSAKYKEAAQLLKYAHTQFQGGRLETASGQSTADMR